MAAARVAAQRENEHTDTAQEIVAANTDTTVASQLFTNYSRNVQYNLDVTKQLPKPV